ncbi:adenosylmethionine decarboxylase [Desulfatiglans anilini]|uniref:adenosylmethionine decarboxylase n=1 Tax=Desulfatiglans anilini TaxID=90728 RepID=UPI0004154D54|nr:adenosylmethionine decarboxylase [Desulfatiglans anilini]
MTSLLDLVLIDLYECDRESLMDTGRIREGMLEAARIMGAEVVGDSFHTFEPWGVSGTVTIAESHLAVHTWPEYDFAAVTFETCGQHMDHKKAYNYLIGFFHARKPRITQQKRGFIESAENTVLPYKQVVG